MLSSLNTYGTLNYTIDILTTKHMGENNFGEGAMMVDQKNKRHHRGIK